MSNSRLENLLLIACEHDVAINYETVIELFAEKKMLPVSGPSFLIKLFFRA